MMFYTVLKCQISVWRDSGNFLIVLAVSIRLWKVSGFAPSLTNKPFFLSFLLLLPCPSEWTLILHCGELLDQSAPSSSFPQKSENPTIKNWAIQALFNTAASCDAGRGMGAVWEWRGQGALSGTSSRSSDQSPWCFAGLTCCRSTPVAIGEMQRGSCTAPDDFIGPVQPQPSLALPLVQVCPSSHPQPYTAQKNARATTFFC